MSRDRRGVVNPVVPGSSPGATAKRNNFRTNDLSGPGTKTVRESMEETRQYIRDFDRIAETAATALALYDQMLKLHALRMNVNALWTSALTIKR